MARRELLMLAKVFDPEKHDVGGYYMSEKLDGCRCFWDGGISRGHKTCTVPWAGILNPKTGQPKGKVKEFSTGLWSRYGNPIVAPDWFLNTLPCCPMDGELWAGRGKYQRCRSIIGKHKPVDEEWKEIQYAVFGAPDFEIFSQDGEIKNSNQITDIRNVKDWVRSIIPSFDGDWVYLSGRPAFSAELANLNEWVDNFADTTFLISQSKLPQSNEEALKIVQKKKEEVILNGGEGLMLRDPYSVWVPKKVPTGLKVKGSLDDEGTLVGFVSGRKTNKGSKLLGLIGALVLDYKGKRLELSGLTDLEREFNEDGDTAYATDYPGEPMPQGTQGRMFKVGDKVTFTYRELTDGGLPKEARYLRKR